MSAGLRERLKNINPLQKEQIDLTSLSISELLQHYRSSPLEQQASAIDELIRRSREQRESRRPVYRAVNHLYKSLDIDPEAEALAIEQLKQALREIRLNATSSPI